MLSVSQEFSPGCGIPAGLEVVVFSNYRVGLKGMDQYFHATNVVLHTDACTG